MTSARSAAAASACQAAYSVGGLVDQATQGRPSPCRRPPRPRARAGASRRSAAGSSARGPRRIEPLGDGGGPGGLRARGPCRSTARPCGRASGRRPAMRAGRATERAGGARPAARISTSASARGGHLPPSARRRSAYVSSVGVVVVGVGVLSSTAAPPRARGCRVGSAYSLDDEPADLERRGPPRATRGSRRRRRSCRCRTSPARTGEERRLGLARVERQPERRGHARAAPSVSSGIGTAQVVVDAAHLAVVEAHVEIGPQRRRSGASTPSVSGITRSK